MAFQTTTRTTALKSSDLIIGATGNLSLTTRDWRELKPGSFVLTVTSSDDEIDRSQLDEARVFEAVQLDDAPFVTRYSTEGTYFYLLNDGNAVNFLHNAVVGNFIYLVQAELVRSIPILRSSEPDSEQIQALDSDERKAIAELWLRLVHR